MKMFAGIDFGKVTSCGIVSVEDGKLRLVDTLQVDLAEIEPKRKGKLDADRLARRLVRLDDFLELVLTSWKFELVGLEVPPAVRDMSVFQQLSMYYGLALARISKVSVPFRPMVVTQWRKWIGICGAPPRGMKPSQRTALVKRTMTRAVNQHLGSTFEKKDHDRADGAGIAIAAAIVKGAYQHDDEIWHT